MLETMDRFAVTQARKIVEKTVRFSNLARIETMDRLAVFQGSKVVETTVRFSNLEND